MLKRIEETLTLSIGSISEKLTVPDVYIPIIRGCSTFRLRFTSPSLLTACVSCSKLAARLQLLAYKSR